MAETIFIDGLRVWPPREGAPEYIKGSISIDPVKLVEFLKANKEYMDAKGYFRADLKESKEGALYISLNTFKRSV